MTTLNANTVPMEILERGENLLNQTSKNEVRQGHLQRQDDQFGQALNVALEEIGERFGLYDIMVQSGPITPACLATQVGAPEQAIRIWLEAQASGGYLHHGVKTDLYSVSSPWSPGQNSRF